MKLLKLNSLPLVLLLSFATLISCKDDYTGENGGSSNSLLPFGTVVNVNNTLTSDAVTMGVETDFAVLNGESAGDYAIDSIIFDSVEFPGYLFGLYTIDISKDTISFDLIAEVDDPTYSAFFRTLEAGTTDRYYFTFEEGHNVSDFSSDNDSVNLRIDSDTVLVVEIGEGFDFNPGSSFTITLN